MSDPIAVTDRKNQWDRAVIVLDVLYKGLILIVGSVVAGAFYLKQSFDAERRSLADFMAQRESSDTTLREQMFQTLIAAFFADMKNTPSTFDRPADRASAIKTAYAQLARLKRESMFSDLLSRNFEDIDVRPLLEDLDTQLSQYLGNDAEVWGQGAIDDDIRGKAFALREYLRRAAIGASSRQVTSLSGGLHAKVVTTMITQCPGSTPEPKLPFDDWAVLADHMSDGSVEMRVWRNEAVNGDAPTNLAVSFYDMPTLENIILPSGERVAFTLNRYVSHDACTNYSKQLDSTMQEDCVALLAEKPACDEAWVQAVVFPDDYVGARDRPYLNDIVEGRLGHMKHN